MTIKGDVLSAAMEIEDPSVLEVVKVATDAYESLLDQIRETASTGKICPSDAKIIALIDGARGSR